jgi:hypothetical protein
MVEEMTSRKVGGLFGALLAGLLGGMLGNLGTAQSPEEKVIKATRFELMTPTGARAGVWEATASGQTHFSIFSSNGSPAFEIVLPAGEAPTLNMRGKDGAVKIVLEVGGFDKPVLRMSDVRGTRVELGYNAPDFPSADWDNWALKLRIPGSERPVAGVGVSTRGGTSTGFLTANGRIIR